MWIVYARDSLFDDGPYDVVPLRSLLGGFAFWFLLSALGAAVITWKYGLTGVGIAVGVVFALFILFLLVLWKTKYFRFYKTEKMQLTFDAEAILKREAQAKHKTSSA
mmetsp:Transcript_9934/g.30457  ORF Transcript_9934/g.30457 Transcript_9934/m.30457 type:complete len:107 (+) Transcript_9934:93-413(+)